MQISPGQSCPIPITDYPAVMLAHGGGGRLMRQLIERLFFAAFENPLLAGAHDSTRLNLGGAQQIAFTTDSYVIHPLFYPGGDIGSLAVFGTVNDLAMSGARPAYLTAAFIIEEGLPMETLWRIVQSMASAAARCGVQIVTGDTKVVDRGKGDGIFINTAGIGILRDEGPVIAPSEIRAGDAILVNGDLGRHGIAIMAVREGIGFETAIESDSAPLHGISEKLLDAGVPIHCMRDLTRGGLASALNELASQANVGIELDEIAVPVWPDVHAGCELLGFDPMYVANEGRMTVIVPWEQAERCLEVMRQSPEGEGAAIIGRVTTGRPGRVVLRTRIGATRILDMLTGEQLPRIC